MRFEKILILILISNIFGLCQQVQGIHISNDLNGKDYPLNLKILKAFNFDKDSIKLFQYLERLNACIITTQNLILMWDINSNEIVFQKQFNTTNSNSNELNLIKYAIISDNQTQNNYINLFIIVHNSQTKELHIQKFSAYQTVINSQIQFRISSNAKVDVSSLFDRHQNVNKHKFFNIHLFFKVLNILISNYTYYPLIVDILNMNRFLNNHIYFQKKVVAIEEINTYNNQNNLSFPSFIHIQLNDRSIRKIQSLFESIKIEYLRNRNDSFFQLQRIIKLTYDKYIFQTSGQTQFYYIQIIDNNIKIQDNNILHRDQILHQTGSLQNNENINYIISSNKINNIVTFTFLIKKGNSNYIQTINYDGYLYFQSLLSQIFLQQKSTNQIFQIDFQCFSNICSQSQKQLIDYSKANTYIIQRNQNAIYLSYESNNLFAYYEKCQTQSEVFNLSDFSCILKDQCKNQFQSMCLQVEKSRYLNQYDNTLSGNQNQINLKEQEKSEEQSSDDSSNDASLQVVQIVLGVVGAIVILLIFVICIRKHRQKQFKRQQEKEQQANEMVNLQGIQQNDLPNQQKYLQIPMNQANLNNSNSNIKNQLLQDRNSNISSAVQGAAPSALSDVNKFNSQSQSAAFNPMFSQQSSPQNHLFDHQGIQNAIQPVGNIGILGPQDKVQPQVPMMNIPGMNNFQEQNYPVNRFSSDPNSLAFQQQQILQQQLCMQQMINQQQQQFLLQMQQLFPQKNFDQFNQLNNVAPQNFDHNNINNNLNGQPKRPQTTYENLSEKMIEDRFVKFPNHANIQKQQNDQNDLDQIVNQQFQNNKFDPPVAPAPPPAHLGIEDQLIYKAPLNHSVPKNGYFFNQKPSNNISQNNVDQNQILKETDILQRNFEQKMRELLASGAVPAGQIGRDNMNGHFIQPAAMQDGEHEPEINAAQIQEYQNGIVANTQILKQKFEDEMLKQLQGTEIFERNKLMQQLQLDPIPEKEFPRFIPENKEEQDNLHKFEDDDNINDFDEQDNYIDENINQVYKNKTVLKQINQRFPQPQRKENQNDEENYPLQQNVQQQLFNVAQSNKDNYLDNQENNHLKNQDSNFKMFYDQMKEQLGESFGKQKADKKFFESLINKENLSSNEIKQLQASYNNFQQNQNQIDQAIDIGQIQLESKEANQKYQNLRDKVLGLNQNNGQQTDNGLNEAVQYNYDLNSDNKITCGICLYRPPQVALQCQHTLCEDCCNQIIKQNNKCPFCDETIQSTFKFILS